MKKLKIMGDEDIIVMGIEALNKALGSTNALRFLTLFHHDSTDYVDISRQLYSEQTMEDIFERAKTHWKG